jgi:hypothetical protein
LEKDSIYAPQFRHDLEKPALSIFELRLPIYDLAAGGPKLQMKSNAKDEVKKKEAGHYSGLSMRTKR